MNTSANPNTAKAHPIKQWFNKVFNDANPNLEDTQKPPEDEGGLRSPQGGIYASFTRSLGQAIVKHAQQKVAELYRINHVRWNLTHLEVFLKSNNKDLNMALTGLADHHLKALFWDALKKSNVADMYKLDEFVGVTLNLEPEDSVDEHLKVLVDFDEGNAAYYFAFDGELGLGDDEALLGSARSIGAGLGGAKEPQQAAPSGGKAAGPVIAFPGNSEGTRMVEELCISLKSPNFWPTGWGHPYANAEEVNVFDLPLTVGRTPQVANRETGEGFGIGQVVQEDQTCQLFLPIYGSEMVSAQHFTLNRNAQGQLCITDCSSNGTWLDNKRLAKGVETPLPMMGALRLGSKSPIYLNFSQTGEWQVQEAPAAKPVTVATQSQVQATTKIANAVPIKSADTHVAQIPASTDKHFVAQETDFSAEPEDNQAATAKKALANLLLRTADGQVSTYAIHHYPFTVGRESTCDVVVPEVCKKVSRLHLRLEQPQMRTNANGVASLRGFRTDNSHAHGRNGTFSKEQPMDITFLLLVHALSGRTGSANEDGWLTLGSARLGESTVQIKLQAVTE